MFRYLLQSLKSSFGREECIPDFMVLVVELFVQESIAGVSYGLIYLRTGSIPHRELDTRKRTPGLDEDASRGPACCWKRQKS